MGNSKKGANNTYWGNVKEALGSLSQGLGISVKHLWQARNRRQEHGISQDNYFAQNTGRFTVQYPKESMPVPDNGRYRLHNEIDDCIVCDKCAKICPVNCIDIEPVRAVDDLGQTSDGTPKRIHAAKFDIDMAKCCFCGLCTTVCPTECLTMTKAYDFSTFDIEEHNYSFSEMTPLQILDARQKLEAKQQEAAAAKAAAKPATGASAKAAGGTATATGARPRPTIKKGPKLPNKPKPPQDPTA